MINKIPCGRCRNYDPILGSKEKETRRGWCTVRSMYPAKEGPGQIFPSGVRRVAAGEIAKPFIVKKDYVHPTCEHARETNVDAAKQKKEQQATIATRKDGRRVNL